MNESLPHDREEDRQQQWPEDFLTGQAEVLELILAGLPLTQVLERIATRVGGTFGDRPACSILLVNAEGSSLVQVAAPALPEDYNHAVGQIPIGANVGSCGAAAATRQPVFIEDITTHPNWASAHDLVKQHGLKACWSLPVFSAEGELLGTIALYHWQHGLPGPEELHRMEAAAKLVSLAIERCRTAEKQRSQERLLRIAGQKARIGGWTVDMPEARLTWSDEVCAIHDVPPGYSPNIREGFEFYAPECRDRIFSAFQQCANDGTPFDEELEIITARQQRIWVRAIGEAVWDEEGTIARIQGALQDISAKKESEVEVRRLAGRLTTTLESITDAFFTLDRDWRFTYLNAEAARLLRKSREELLGKIYWDEFREAAGTELGQAYENAMAGRQTAVLDEHYYIPFREWFEVRAYPSDEGLAVYFRNVTLQRQSREQLKLLETCVSRLNDILMITEAEPIDEPGPRIVFVNDAFTTHTGYTREEALGKPARILRGPKTQQPELDRIRIALKKGNPVRGQLINHKKDGTQMWVEIDAVPVKNEAGKSTYMVVVERDITERKQSEEGTRSGEERYVRQRNSLITLTGIQPLESDDRDAAFRRITEAHARALGVARVGIWRYNAERTAIRCVDLYEMEHHRHSSGMELTREAFPGYFRALEEMDVIAADNAYTDERTREFSDDYLRPLGISAMLDAPVMVHGHIDGVICGEHIGSPRQWSGDEKTFAAAVANLVSLALEGEERRRAEAAVREIQQRFEIVASATNDAVWDWEFSTGGMWWSEGFEKLFGHRREQVEKTVVSWTSRIHPEEVDRVVEGIRRVIDGSGEHWTDEYHFLRADGSYAYVLDRGIVMRDATGRGVRMVGGMSDLTARKQAEMDLARLNRALKMLSACNEAVTRASGEEELLTEICRLAVNTGGYRMAWVGYAQDDAEHSIKPAAFAGVEDGYLSEIRLSWDENRTGGRGPGGKSIRNNAAVICEDVETAEIAEMLLEWLPAVRQRGYRSIICLPLREGDRVFGLLGLYGSETRKVTEDEIKLLQELADDLAYGIGTLRSRLERQRAEEVVLKVARAVSSGIGREFFDLLTSNMVEAMEAHGGLIGRLNSETLEITTLSFVLEGKLMDNVTYGLAGTPCENVSQGNVCIFDRGVQEIFPEDHLLVHFGIHAYAGIPLFQRDGTVAGIMVVFFSSPLQEKETALVQSTLQIFAARAAAELDRQVADARIREQASLLDRARDAILVGDLDHRISYWNKSAERLYGWPIDEALGRSVEELLYRDVRSYREAYRTVVETGEWVGEIQQYDRQGRELMIEGRWTLLRDSDDQPLSILSINTDVTEHKKLEQHFLRSQRLESIGTLAGGIAHDLNNVLAPISMSIELLKSDVSSERGKELLETLASSARRGAEMVNQVLSFARGMEGRRMELHVHDLVDDLEKIVRDTFPKNISLRTNIPRSLCTLQGDPTQLHQVLLNLCVNARDAMPQGGEITISAENVDLDQAFASSERSVKPGPHVVIKVEDDGHGIPPAVLDKIFEPFFTTKEVGKGTGLGLSTSMAIVKSHGGFIRAASAPGKGSCFLIVLPALAAPGKSGISGEDPDLPRGSGETILVADDEPSIRQIMRHMLESFGYRVLLAADGAEAVQIYRQHRGEIAVVITDMMMPVMDGTSTIHELSSIDPKVRIIAASGISDQAKLAKEAGDCVRYFVRKPCTADTLLKALEITISRDS